MEFSEIDFFHTLTIQNDQISYVKHVLDPVHVFFTLFGVGGGLPRGLGHTTCLRSFQANSKIEISETDFFHTLTIQNDQISYVKHVLDPVHVFFTLFGCGGGGGVPRGVGHTTCLCSFQASATQKIEISETDFFDTLTIQNDQISYVKHVLAPLPSSRCLAEGNRICHKWPKKFPFWGSLGVQDVYGGGHLHWNQSR